jgi:hypothetical protein
MTQFEARMFEKFSEAVEDAIARYLADKDITDKGIEEYFGKHTFVEKVKSYREILS